MLTLEPHLNGRTVDARKGERGVRNGEKKKKKPSFPMHMEMAHKMYAFYKKQPYAIFARKVLDRHVFEGGYRELWMGELERISTPEQRSELERKLRRAVFEYKVLFGMCPYFYYEDDDGIKDFNVPSLIEGKFIMEWSENLLEYRPTFRLNRDPDRPVGLYVWEEPLPDGTFGGPFPFLLDRWTVVKRLYSDLQTASHWASNPFNFLQARKTAEPRVEDLSEEVRFGGDVLSEENGGSETTPQMTAVYQRNRLQAENLEMKVSMLTARNNGGRFFLGRGKSGVEDGDPRRLADRIREPMDGGNYFFLPPDMERASHALPSTPKELERVETLMQEDLSLSLGIPKTFLSGIHTSTRSNQAKEIQDFVQTTVVEARSAMTDFYFRVYSEMHRETAERIVSSALRRISGEKARLKKKKRDMEKEKEKEDEESREKDDGEKKSKKKKKKKERGKDGRLSEEELDRAILRLKEQYRSLADSRKESLGFVLQFKEAAMVNLEQILVLADNEIISPEEKVSLGRRTANIPERKSNAAGPKTQGGRPSSDETKNKNKNKRKKTEGSEKDVTRDGPGGNADREPARKSRKKDADRDKDRNRS